MFRLKTLLVLVTTSCVFAGCVFVDETSQTDSTWSRVDNDGSVTVRDNSNGTSTTPMNGDSSTHGTPTSDQDASFEREDMVGCYFNGIPLWGEVQVVDAFPDIEVRVVDAFPDLDVEIVDAFPDDCGEWEFVDAFPDFTIQFVDAFPDLEIEYVDAFPGI